MLVPTISPHPIVTDCHVSEMRMFRDVVNVLAVAIDVALTRTSTRNCVSARTPPNAAVSVNKAKVPSSVVANWNISVNSLVRG